MWDQELRLSRNLDELICPGRRGPGPREGTFIHEAGGSRLSVEKTCYLQSPSELFLFVFKGQKKELIKTNMSVIGLGVLQLPWQFGNLRSIQGRA